MGRRLAQSVCWKSRYIRKYYSNTEFIRSVWPSDWGWKVEERLARMPRSSKSRRQKCDVNTGSRSLTKESGKPWARITCWMNKEATSGADMDFVVAMKMACFVSRFTTTRIAS